MVDALHHSTEPRLNLFSPMPTPVQQPAIDTRLYLGAVLLLTTLSLWPIWAIAFPPLQDYPQHLFLAHVNATYSNPAYNWPQHYLATLKTGPYTLFYLIIVFLEKILPVTVAGRVFLSLYILMTAGLTVVMRQCRMSNNPPWGCLILFPLAFHQMYFMGFTNFLFSIPLLAFTILDHQRLTSQPPSALSLMRQAGLVALLVLCHPFTLLVYIALASANSLLPLHSGASRKTALIPPAATSVFFLTWYFTSLPSNHGKIALLWWQTSETLRYYCLMFTGMRWADGINWPTTATWLAAIGIILWGGIRAIRAGASFPHRTGLAFALTTAGFLVLPFWAGQYSYFNLRMAPISYLFAGLLAGSSRLPRWAGLCLASLAAMLVIQSVAMQQSIARETAEIQPIITAIETNSRILPMTFRTDSAVLDRHFFPEAHSHDHFYYHLLQGGGASPSLFPSPMLPVLLRPDADLPLATHGFSWQEQGKKYDYILTRGAPAEFTPFITRFAPLVKTSGHWLLFKNKHNP